LPVDRISDALPDRYAFSHDFAFTLHDTLTGYLVDGQKANLFRVEFELDPVTGTTAPTEDEDVFDWLERIDRGDVLGDVLHRTLFSGVLADACHFIYESLRCAEKGKLTVAYALVRKPLKESLYYLEMLLGDPERLLNTFWNKSVSELAIGVAAQRNRAIPIIRTALSRMLNRDMYNPDFIYDARFDKTAVWGLEPYWNQASHLITDRPPLRTERQNLNFVFSSHDAIEDQWGHLYGLVPFLLFYMVDVCTSLMLMFLRDDDVDPAWGASLFQRALGFMVWARDSHAFRDPSAPPPPIRDLELKCPACGGDIESTRTALVTLFNYDAVECSQCGVAADIVAIHESSLTSQ
jgi:hypothetical protein